MIRGFKFRLSGRWAQFRRPETNNTPLTHDFITKPALLGLGGALLGWERLLMREQFSILSDDLLYSVQLNRPVKKESWAFTLRNAAKQEEKSPRPMEFLRDPDFTIVIGLKNERSATFFDGIAEAIQNSEARYTPTLGLQNCPAELFWIEQGEIAASDGPYRTSGFFLRNHRLLSLDRIQLGFDRIPSFQTSEWWNLPERRYEVAYSLTGESVEVDGPHYRFSGREGWCLI